MLQVPINEDDEEFDYCSSSDDELTEVKGGNLCNQILIVTTEFERDCDRQCTRARRGGTQFIT
jgi:hypothetical protein